MNQSRKLIVVTLMTPHGETGVQTHFNAILDEAAKRGIETKLIHPYSRSVIIGRKAAGLVGKFLRMLNKEWLVLWNRWTHYLLLRYQLRRYLQPDTDEVVLYAQDPLSCRAALASRTSGQRVVAVAHFNISEADEVVTKGLTVAGGRLYRHLQHIERQTLPFVDTIIFVSAFMQQQVNKRLPLLTAVPQHVIANFVQDHGNQQSRPELTGDLITIGTLEKRKNLAFLLRVLAQAHARGHRYRLTIIGKGPDWPMLEKLAAELHLSDSVRFLGFQANAAAYMAGHRVYVHAALMESFGITLIEALSHALPILAPAVGGIPDVFTDGQEGYFWPLDDVNEAADKLCGLLENEELRTRLSGQARRRFENHFSAQALADVWLSAIMNP